MKTRNSKTQTVKPVTGTRVVSSSGDHDFSKDIQTHGTKVINNRGVEGALEIDRSSLSTLPPAKK